jgi:Ran GTPase-activating protein (RanGAP) involved in mRNA processing and transport
VLKSLDLSDNPLGLASFEALGEALGSRAALKVLRLDRTGAGMGGALEALANALVSSDCTLRSLSLRKNNIRGLGACVLADALAENTCLHSLELGSNNISEAPLADGSAGSATRYAMALQENTTLRSLDLGHNDVGDVGAVQLATALEHTMSLQKLVLSHNLQITSAGCASFIKAKQMSWVDDIVITSSEGDGGDGGGDGLDALVEGGTAKETSRSAAVRAKKAASATARMEAGKAPLTVELVGCFTKGNIPASLLIELGML